MTRKKIVWLCSWYPTRVDPFNGDFIQRHARAAALYNDIYVIYVAEDRSGSITTVEKEIKKYPGLTEHIVLYPATKGVVSRLFGRYKWLFLLRQAIRRFVVENKKPNLVHVQVPMAAGLAALWFKSRYKVPYYVTEHYGIYNEIIGKDSFANRTTLYKKLTARIFSKAERFISVSKYLGDGVNLMVTKKDFTVVPNAVDTELFFYKEKPQTVFRFIHVSNMIPLKNAGGIIRAFHALLRKGYQAELIMVGGEHTEAINIASALRFPPGIVRFTGEVSYREVAAEMQSADCLVLFSTIENSPCVIGEALCCGLPVIASRVGGIPELVTTGNAILVTSKAEDELTAAMERMLTDHSFDKKKIAEDAAGKFSYPAVGKLLEEEYSKQVISL